MSELGLGDESFIGLPALPTPSTHSLNTHAFRADCRTSGATLATMGMEKLLNKLEREPKTVEDHWREETALTSAT